MSGIDFHCSGVLVVVVLVGSDEEVCGSAASGGQFPLNAVCVSLVFVLYCLLSVPVEFVHAGTLPCKDIVVGLADAIVFSELVFFLFRSKSWVGDEGNCLDALPFLDNLSRYEVVIDGGGYGAL